MIRLAALGVCLAMCVAEQGCASALPLVVDYAPIVENAVCQIAADQGAAEPGWEVYACAILDPSGKPTGASVIVHTPKGHAPLGRHK